MYSLGSIPVSALAPVLVFDSVVIGSLGSRGASNVGETVVIGSASLGTVAGADGNVDGIADRLDGLGIIDGLVLGTAVGLSL
jgi:hypothetical protein